MKKQVIISALHNMAIIINKNKIEEFLFFNKQHQVNNIYVGVVDKIFPGINAAFIDIGKKCKRGFIHLNDLNSLRNEYSFANYKSDTIKNTLTTNQKILVQITKESYLNKGARLTTNISLIGKYIILMPYNNNIIVSRKIHQVHDRHYLKSLGILIKPSTVGLLFRSAAMGVSEKMIMEEMHLLRKQWNFMQKLAIQSNFAEVLYNDNHLEKRICRDYPYLDITDIVSDSYKIHFLAKHYKSSFLSECTVTQFNKTKKDIFRYYHIDTQIKNSLKTRVPLMYGGYIIIDILEALTIIDVNSGGFNQAVSHKEMVYKINLVASKEIAHQLKLRNIAGLVIVDFIDMQSQREQLHVLEYFHKCLAMDRNRTQIVQLSELGLVELTRKRKSKSLHELFDKQQLLTVKYKRNMGNFKKKSQLFSLIDLEAIYSYTKTINYIRIAKDCKNIRYNNFSKISSTYDILTKKPNFYRNCTHV